MTGPTEPTLEDLAADRDLWRSRALSMLEVIAAIEHVFDVGIVGRTRQTITVTAASLDDVQNQFDAWRRLVEANIPTDWRVAGEDGEPHGFVPDDDDVPF